MATKLIQCAACRKEISAEATACPHCGHPVKAVKPKSSSASSGCLVLIILGFVFMMVLARKGQTPPNRPASTTSKPVTTLPYRKNTREEIIAALFSQWDGSCPALVAAVKAGMHDGGKSFEHVETKYDDQTDGEFIRVKMIFRGKNAFNAVVTNTATATVTFDQKVSDLKIE